MNVRLPLTPMRAETLTRAPNTAGPVLIEPKFDGWRVLVIRTDAGVQVQSRHLKDLTRYFPDVASAALALPTGTVVDGELVIWDAAEQRTAFGLLGRRITAGKGIDGECSRHPAHVVCFDLLYLRGRALMQQPLSERREHLVQLLEAGPSQLALCPQTDNPAEAELWMQDGAAAGIEGILIKPAAGRYLPGRAGWWKLRARESTEAVVAGITGTLHNPSTVLLARIDHKGQLRYIGRSTPLSKKARQDLARLLLTTDSHPWPRPLPASWQGPLGQPEPLRYIPVAPALVAEVAADAAYEGGRYRHPVQFIRARLDLDIADLPMWTVR